MSAPIRREPRLPARAEALLEGWPAPARGALDWEESANAVMTRIRGTASGSTSDALLSPPLPEQADESAERSGQPVAPQPEEPSLAEIARAAVAASDAANKAVARDGLIAAELGRKNPPRDLTPSPRAAASASVAELQGRVARVSAPVKSAPEKSPPVVPEKPPMTAVDAQAGAPPVIEAAARSVHPGAPVDERKRRMGPAIFGGSVVALAAAAALYFSFERHAAREASLSAVTEGRPASAQTQPASAPTAPERVAAASATTAAPSALVLEELKAAPSPAEVATPKAIAASKGLAFRVKKESEPNAGKLVLEERDETSNAGPAQNEAAAAVPPPAQAQTLAERPSTGAIQGAFGAVLMSARSCLAGQETGTRAVVTFDGPTGRVKSVVLEGPAAGSPAEPCVRAALMAAKLSPFAEQTYSASVTVRPL